MGTTYVEDLADDAKRLDWLLKQGVAWRGCYKDDWKEGEWLYEWQNARDSIDEAMASGIVGV